MQTERLTVLMEPKYKAAVAKQAAARGVSTSEHVRNALDSFDANVIEDEAQLAALVEEASLAIPKMRASINSMIETLERSHRETDQFLRKMGVR